MRVKRFAAVGWAAVLAAAPAIGCPVCDSGTGREVRAGIVGTDGAELAVTVLGTVLPFLVIGAAVALIHFGGGAGGPRGARRAE